MPVEFIVAANGSLIETLRVATPGKEVPEN